MWQECAQRDVTVRVDVGGKRPELGRVDPGPGGDHDVGVEPLDVGHDRVQNTGAPVHHGAQSDVDQTATTWPGPAHPVLGVVAGVPWHRTYHEAVGRLGSDCGHVKGRRAGIEVEVTVDPVQGRRPVDPERRCRALKVNGSGVADLHRIEPTAYPVDDAGYP